jgi:DNA repair exonuclease SbcCD ATPase subunit
MHTQCISSNHKCAKILLTKARGDAESLQRLETANALLTTQLHEQEQLFKQQDKVHQSSKMEKMELLEKLELLTNRLKEYQEQEAKMSEFQTRYTELQDESAQTMAKLQERCTTAEAEVATLRKKVTVLEVGWDEMMAKQNASNSSSADASGNNTNKLEEELAKMKQLSDTWDKCQVGLEELAQNTVGCLQRIETMIDLDDLPLTPPDKNDPRNAWSKEALSYRRPGLEEGTC